MDQVLGRHAGNALELRESLDALATPAAACPRLRAVTLALAGRLLQAGGLAVTPAEGQARAARAWDSGAAASDWPELPLAATA